MGRFIIVVSLLVVGLGVGYSREPQEMKEASVRPKNGFVPDADTAVKIAEAVLIPMYGEKKVSEERPFTATRQGGTWIVTGALNCGAPKCTGGTAVVKMSKTTGEILFLSHYK